MLKPKYETASRHNKVTRPSRRERKAAYTSVAVRSDGKCEGCGNAEAVAMHHRKYRSRGGEDIASNLLHLCLDHHGVAHTKQGELLGWSVRSRLDPLVIPVRMPVGWVLLDGSGARMVLRDIEALELRELYGMVA